MVHKYQLFGLLCALTSKENLFNQHNLQLLLTVTSLSSTAAYNTFLFNQLESLYIETVKAFVKAIEAKDSYTRGHSENVALYATIIAQELGLDRIRINKLRTAALLHDIGKIGIKEEILNKPARLNAEEYEHIKMHPQISFQILRHMPNLKDLATIVLHHHEKYDGTGYPEGLVGENIPYEARILAVADAFDAMTSSRPYKQAVITDTACNELLKGKGTQFDPQIVDAFVEIIESGRIAHIVRNGKPFDDSKRDVV
ncbi:MAG: HD-GYP domain-containing protein [Rubrobacteridae bacterium]|nr:HD-GYP domain-containing protein [Rubrobacteridae bacterium]